MYESIASGGPLNGIRICAALSWNGWVRNTEMHTSKLVSAAYHPGCYVWDSEQCAWVWHVGRFERLPDANRLERDRPWRLIRTN